LKSHLLSEKWDEVLEDELMELKSGEQAFMATRPKLIQAGYTTLNSIPRLRKGSGTRFDCPALKGVDSRTQKKESKWIQLLHKHPAHLHALDIKDTEPQRDPGNYAPPAKRTFTEKLYLHKKPDFDPRVPRY